MTRSFNFYLLEYTFGHIRRNGFKNLFLTLVMTLLVALLGSTFFLSNAMKLEYSKKIMYTPDIVVKDTKAMRETLIDKQKVSNILSINGVSSAVNRIYGSYHFVKLEKYFTIIGVDEFETYPDENLNGLLKRKSFESDGMLVSKELKELLKKSYYDDYFNFVKADGTLKKVMINDTFETEDKFNNKYLIIISETLAQEIFNYPKDKATDIAVTVANKDEIGFIANKIATKLPNAKIELKEDLLVQYESLYNFKSGFFLTIFIISFFTYFIIIYDKMSGLSSEEKREIGVLKAIGWRVSDVLNAKLYEGLIISFFSYIVGVVLAFIYVYLFNAPLLKGIFLKEGNLLENVSLMFSLDYETLALLFFLSVPLYIAATIIPSWRVATLEADEVMR